MTAERFRCPVCAHWCTWADGFGWVCSKRGGCGSEWPEDDAAPDQPADGRESYTDAPELTARLIDPQRKEPSMTTVAAPTPENPDTCANCGHPVFVAQIGAQRVWTHGTTVGVGSYGIDCPEPVTA